MYNKRKPAWVKVKTRTGTYVYINISYITNFFVSNNNTFIEIANRNSPVIANGNVAGALSDILQRSRTYTLYNLSEKEE